MPEYNFIVIACDSKSNISLHHHFFDVNSRELGDIEAEQFGILGMPEPLPDKSVAGGDVVVRLKLTG